MSDEPADAEPAPHEAWSHGEGGTYTTQTVFLPGFTIDFGETPFERQAELGEGVFFFVEDVLDGQPGWLAVLNSSAVPADPRDEAADAEEGFAYTPPPDPAAGDVDLATWLRHHPRLDATEEELIEIAGLEASQFDVAVRPREAYPAPECVQFYGVECVYIFSEEVYALTLGNRLRVIAVDVAGEQVVILIEAPKATFGAWAAEAEKILSTLTFEPVDG